FNIVPGPADHITVTSSTANLTSTTSRTLTAEIRDANQNVLTTDNTTSVTFAKTAGTGTVSGLGSATAASGVASLSVTGVLAGSITITASASGVGNCGTTYLNIATRPADPLTTTSSADNLAFTASRKLAAEVRDAYH